MSPKRSFVLIISTLIYQTKEKGQRLKEFRCCGRPNFTIILNFPNVSAAAWPLFRVYSVLEAQRHGYRFTGKFTTVVA